MVRISTVRRVGYLSSPLAQKGQKLQIKSQNVQHDQRLVIPMHHVFQWRRLQRLVGPQDRYGERSEPPLKRKCLSLQPKESEPLGARHLPAVLFFPPSSERRFLLRGGSFSLSNSVQRSVKHGNDRQHKPEDPRRNSYAGLTFNSSYAHTVHYTSVVCIYCACECLAAPSRPSPVSRLFHAGCTSS